MRNRALALACLLAVAALPTAAPAGASKGLRTQSSNKAAAQTTVALGIELLRAQPNGNLVLSPESAATALAMAGEGAAGATAAQIAHVLRLRSPGSFGSLGALKRTVIAEQVTGASGPERPPELSMPDALFVQRGFAVESPFLTALRLGFAAPPTRLDFARNPAAATQDINSWVNSHTNGLIRSVLTELPDSTRLVLANAVYLKAMWASPFEKGEEATFHAPGGDEPVHFMKQIEKLEYASTARYSAIELPYRSSTLSMLIVLPSTSTVASVQRLSAADLEALVKHMLVRRVELLLPKFHISSKLDLAEPLAALGMPLAFGAGADFSRISRGNSLRIGAVSHAADINVDARGTIAAAVTLISLEGLGPKPTGEVRFLADHPFLYFIRDNRTGAILFAGRLEDAAAAQS